MRIPRIYQAGALVPGETISLRDQPARHIAQVLRLQPGAELCLFNGDGKNYQARLLDCRRDEVRVQLGKDQLAATESPLSTVLLQGICRGSRMDLVIQKATELGVGKIVPVDCERSVVRLSQERAARRRSHWEGIAIGAAEQCGRAMVPEISAPMKLAQAIDSLPRQSIGLLLNPKASRSIRQAVAGTGSVALLVGPEGGLSTAEVDHATTAKFRSVSLGPRVLRTETAALVALSLVQFCSGDLDRE